MKLKVKGKGVIWVSLAYFFITLIFTYPLIFNISSHIPAYGKGGDAHSFLWNSRNFKEALEEPTHNLLSTSSILYPFEPNLTFHTYDIQRNFFVFLFSKFIPFIASFNLVTILMFTFSGVGAYLLTLRFGCSRFAAFLSGFIFSFCPFKMARLLAHYNFADTAFIPFFIIFLYTAWNERRLLPAFAAGVSLAFIGYGSYYYLVFAFLFMAFFILYYGFPPAAQFISKKKLSRKKRRILNYSQYLLFGLSVFLFSVILIRGSIRFFRSDVKNANGIYPLLIAALLLSVFFRFRINLSHFISSVKKRLHSLYRDKTLFTVIIIILVFLILFMPILINLFKYHEAYFVKEGAYGNSPEITKLVTPGPDSLLYKRVFKLEEYGIEKIIFLGFVVLLGGIYSIFLARGKPEIKFWQVIALIFTVHSLGPYLLVAGKKIIWLPFQITHSLPFFSAALNPARYIIISMLAMGILTAYAADDILSRLKQKKHKKWLYLGFCALSLVMIGGEYATLPLHMFSLRPHEYYQEMARDDENYSLLELPFSISSKGKTFGKKERLGLYQYYQTIHGKALPTGWLANLPFKIFDYYRNVSFIPNIAYLQELTTTISPKTLNSLILPDPQFCLYLNLYNIKQINIHRGAIKAYGIRCLKSYFKKQFKGVLRYSIRGKDNLIILKIHSDLAKPFLGENLIAREKALALTEGWSRWIWYQGKFGRWVIAKDASLLFSTPEKRSFRLEIDCHTPEFAPNKKQVLEIRLNSSLVDKFSYSVDAARSVTLPQELVRPGSNVITFHFRDMFRVPIAPTPPYRIGRTDTYSPVDIEAASSSKAINFQGMGVLFPLRVGQQRIYNKFKAGYNIFVVNEKTGKILAHRSFDTHTHGEDSRGMSTFIGKIKAGRIVIAITWGNAFALLSDEAVAALKTIGAQKDIRQWPGYCHTIIGVKGANPGEAMEKLNLNKATLLVGQYSNADKVAAWFNSIKMF